MISFRLSYHANGCGGHDHDGDGCQHVRRSSEVRRSHMLLSRNWQTWELLHYMAVTAGMMLSYHGCGCAHGHANESGSESGHDCFRFRVHVHVHAHGEFRNDRANGYVDLRLIDSMVWTYLQSIVRTGLNVRMNGSENVHDHVHGDYW